MEPASDRLRIGSFAELAGTTPRTIRYYEELGLLPCPESRVRGQHRCYTPEDVERVRQIVRLRDLLGLSLEELAEVVRSDGALLERVRLRRRELRELERRLAARRLEPAR